MIRPQPFPDESIGSLLTRLCRLNGIADYEDVATYLLGPGPHTTFINAPVDIVEFCSRTEGAYGDPGYVLENLTWIGPGGRLDVNSPSMVATMAAGLVRPTLAEMIFPESVSLRYCPVCRESDFRQNGMSYWRRQHQIPIVWFCAEHGVPLLKVPIKRADLHATFPLPGDFDRPVPVGEDGCKDSRLFMQAVALLVRDFFECTVTPPAAVIHGAIVNELQARKLLFGNCHVRLTELVAQLRSLLPVPETLEDQELPTRVLKRLDRFLTNSSQAGPGFEALLLVQWLFGSLAGLKEKCAWLQVIGMPSCSTGSTTHSAGFRSYGELHRHRCMQFISDHPSCSRLDFTKSEYRSFRWLLHHDATWLNARLPIYPRESAQLPLF